MRRGDAVTEGGDDDGKAEAGEGRLQQDDEKGEGNGGRRERREGACDRSRSPT